MSPDEANILRYLEGKNYRSRDAIARHFCWETPMTDLRLRSLLSHSYVEEDAKRYYRITELGIEELTRFDDHWKVRPFDGSRIVV